jgi:hypothetical protein
MNYFTKKELQMIYENYKGTQYSDISDKAKLIIDNCCEHEWHTNPYNYVLYCQKCEETTKSDTQEKLLKNKSD